jgi:hypothetical protein
MFWLCNDVDQNGSLNYFLAGGQNFKVGVVHSNTGFFM